MLTGAQQNRVRMAVYRSCNGCAVCMPFEPSVPTWTSTLGDAVLSALEQSGVWAEIPTGTKLRSIISELGLRCPACGAEWLEDSAEVGQALPTPMGQMLVSVPTLNEGPSGHALLAQLWQQVPHAPSSVTFTFDQCQALRPTGVAFLGGIASSIQSLGGEVSFAWDTMFPSVRVNLMENGFAGAFGGNVGAWVGEAIPYRRDQRHNAASIIAYLRQRWLGSRWIKMSQQLINAIVGNVWEIYENAFEYSGSPLGVFTCGQHFPAQNELTLSVIDLGEGIPGNVARYFKRTVAADAAMRWAFKRGTSTNPAGVGRGLGLDILKRFVAVNQGRLEVSSRSGYAEITTNGERFQQLAQPFPGTAVRISLRCDESFYHLAHERRSTPFF